MTEQVRDTTSTAPTPINVSPVAAAKVKSLLAQEGRDDLALRHLRAARWLLGPCATSSSSTSAASTADVVTDFDGVAVVVDRMSVPTSTGAMIDFVDTIEKQGFTIDNPTPRLVRLRRLVPLIVRDSSPRPLSGGCRVALPSASGRAVRT
jgi:Fe-S cluster assembly iron-binding protein IscA